MRDPGQLLGARGWRPTGLGSEEEIIGHCIGRQEDEG